MNTCAIICTGTSARNYKLNKIKVPKVGVNWSYLGTESDVHVISNMIFIRKYKNNVKEVISAPVIYSGLQMRGVFTPKQTLFYAGMEAYNSGVKVPPIPKNYNIYKDGWVFAGGGPCALQAAVSLGFNNIVFIGLDLYTNADCHFYSTESKTGAEFAQKSGYSRVQLKNAWIIQDSYFNQVSEGLKEQGIRVTNLGVSTVFPRGDFQEIC